MTFIVEDGTNVAGANSLCSVEFADSYFANRSNALWAALSLADKQTSLIKATDYIEAKYLDNWKGSRSYLTQDLSFPRYDIYVDGVEVADDSIPVRLKHAVCELANQSLSGDLMPNIERQTKREKIDAIEIEYMDNQSAEVSYTMAHRLIAPYLLGASGSNASVLQVVR